MAQRTAQAFAPARFGFSTQLATPSERSISRREIDSFDARAPTGVPPSGFVERLTIFFIAKPDGIFYESFMKTRTLSKNSIHSSLRRCGLLLFPLLLGGFGLSPTVQAVSPPPDGGYPNFNTAEGQNALFSITTGAANTAVGWFSLFSNAEGSFNTATGAGALLFNTAEQNTAFGAAALFFHTTGEANTAVGTAALLNNTIGTANTATGLGVLLANTTGMGNTALGASALGGNTTGDDNTAIGNLAGANQSTGSGNVYIGTGMLGVAGESNACYIRSIFGQTSASGIPIVINSNNKLGTTTSSKRFKEEIKAMDKASEALVALKPVTFRYKKDIDPAGTLQFGLAAEDVEKVNPDLVVRDQEGKPYSVRYDQVNAMLLNEFLKEHRRVEDQARKLQRQESKAQQQEERLAKQDAIITQQQKQIKALAANVREQAAAIQKVNARLEADKPTQRVVANDR
jgi:hypothetical protein